MDELRDAGQTGRSAPSSTACRTPATTPRSRPRRADGRLRRAGPAGWRPTPQTRGRTVVALGDHDRPQDDRVHVPDHVVRVLLHSPACMALLIRAELFEPGHPDRAEQGAVQPALHDARHDHAAALRDAAVRGLRERHHAAADRRAGRRVPAAEHARRTGCTCSAASSPSAGFFTPQGAASFGWFAYAPLSTTTYSPGLGGDLWVFGLALTGFGTILGAVNFITTIITMRAPGHDDVPDADLHLEHPGHEPAGADGVPAARGGAVRASAPTAGSGRRCSTPRTAARCSGSTCSGSSGTPRSTSSRCRSSASSARSSRSSAASRSSATRAWSTRRSRSRRSR